MSGAALIGLAGLCKLLPAAALGLLPVTPLDAVLVAQRLPRLPRLDDAFLVEEVKRAIEAEHLVTPLAVGDRHVPRIVGRDHVGGKQDRLIGITLAARAGVRQEAVRAPRP